MLELEFLGFSSSACKAKQNLSDLQTWRNKIYLATETEINITHFHCFIFKHIPKIFTKYKHLIKFYQFDLYVKNDDNRITLYSSNHSLLSNEDELKLMKRYIGYSSQFLLVTVKHIKILQSIIYLTKTASTAAFSFFCPSFKKKKITVW